MSDKISRVSLFLRGSRSRGSSDALYQYHNLLAL